MKKILLCLLLSFTSIASAQAQNIGLCHSPQLSRMKSVVYENFMDSLATKKYQFTYVYRSASDAVSAAITAGCKTNKSIAEILSDSSQACIHSCDQTATGMFDNQMWGLGKKTKEKELFNECAGTCKASMQSVRYYLLGTTSPEND